MQILIERKSQISQFKIFMNSIFLGDVTLSLAKLPSPAKTAKQCNLDFMETSPTASIFKIKKCRGWWPFEVNPEDDDDPDPILAVNI